MMVALVVVSSSQIVLSIPWNEDQQSRLHVGGRLLVVGCMLALKLSPVNGVFVKDKGLNENLADCDNNMLLFKNDVCAKHGADFDFCSMPEINQYLVVRGLGSDTRIPNNLVSSLNRGDRMK
jgi:hypothetical protein